MASGSRSSTRSGAWEIWTTDPEGAEFHQVTSLGGYNVAWPVWSADGKRMAYTLFGLNTFLIENGKPWGAETPEKLPPFPGQGQVFSGWNWSADGRTLAGFLNRDDGVVIYSPDSQTFRRLTESGSDPAWLSDSRRLLFLNKGTICLLDSASGRSKGLVSATPRGDRPPRVRGESRRSPDLFQREHDRSRRLDGRVREARNCAGAENTACPRPSSGVYLNRLPVRGGEP